MTHLHSSVNLQVGVGLRHQHIADALNTPAAIDFVEVHSENYFAQGGALHHLLSDVADAYPVSLHSTAMGLGSAAGIPDHYLQQLDQLARVIQPVMMSDHAAFAWGEASGKTVHGGDLLPLVYNQQNLMVMIQHVDQIQQKLGRQLLVENLSAYLSLPGSTMSEQEFLIELRHATGCGLLIDLNNILVNAHNDNASDPLKAGREWLNVIPSDSVGEIHLAGFTPPGEAGIAIDDHAQPVSHVGWGLYIHAIRRFGAIPTLIEWDNQLPDWPVLVAQAEKARSLAQEVLSHG